MDVNVYSKYINFFYWALCCSSSGAPGDIFGVSDLERVFQVLTMMFFRIFVVFLFSEISNLYSLNKTALQIHLDQ